MNGIAQSSFIGRIRNSPCFVSTPRSFSAKPSHARNPRFLFSHAEPERHYRELLGGGPAIPSCSFRLPSRPQPGRPGASRIRTHFKSRETTLQEVAEAVETLVRERPGNYFVYLPSYQSTSRAFGDVRTTAARN